MSCFGRKKRTKQTVNKKSPVLKGKKETDSEQEVDLFYGRKER